MGAPTVYYYDDPGAPVLTNGQDAFYQVIKACLVDGYGSKPAAGWSVVYDDWAASGHASFANAGQSGVLGLARSPSSNYPPFLYIADGMINAQTAVGARSGRLSVADVSAFAEGSFETQRPVHFTAHWPAWCVVANDNWAWCWIGSNSSNLFSDGGSSATQFSCCGFGAVSDFWGLGLSTAPELGNFAIVGGGLTQWIGNSSYACDWRTYQPSSVRGGTPFRRTDGAALSGTVGSLIWPYCEKISSVSAVLSYQVDGLVQIPLHRAIVGIDQDNRNEARYCYQQGYLPGLLTNASLANGANPIQSGIMDLRDAFDVSGRQVLVCRVPPNTLSLVSLDSRDWA